MTFEPRYYSVAVWVPDYASDGGTTHRVNLWAVSEALAAQTAMLRVMFRLNREEDASAFKITVE